MKSGGLYRVNKEGYSQKFFSSECILKPNSTCKNGNVEEINEEERELETSEDMERKIDTLIIRKREKIMRRS